MNSEGTYGPQMEKNDGWVISNFIVQALSGLPITIYGDGTQTRSFYFVEDTVEGLYKLVTVSSLAGSVVNIGNPNENTIAYLARKIKRMTKSSSPITFEKIGKDDPKKRKPDINKAMDLLDWKPQVKLEEGLQKTIDYFSQKFV